MAKKNVVEEEVDKFKKTRTGKFLGMLKGAGNGVGSRVVRDDDEKDKDAEAEAYNTRPGRNTPTAKDVNLPDPKKGQIVGSIDEGEMKDSKGNKFRFERPIRGGDPDDPRYEKYDEENRKLGYKKRYRPNGVSSRALRD